MELMERAQQIERGGSPVIHMEVGEPDFGPSNEVLRAGQQALAQARTRYTAATGLPELREAIARHYRSLGVGVDHEQIIVTSGASGGLMLLAAALLEPGDQLLVTDPGYPCNDVFAKTVGADVIRIPVTPASRFQPTWDQIEGAWTEQTRGVLLASPANPTGTLVPRPVLQALCENVVSDGFIIVDEIYQGLVSDTAPYRTALTISDRPIILQSFSKYFGMTGWRLGWIVVPPALFDPLRRLAQNLFISPPTVSQYAALAAFEPAATQEHERRRQIFQQRMKQLADGLESLGLLVPVRPEGAFYIYADVSASGMTASAFSRCLLEEYHIAATPGLDFGEYENERYLRFACTVDAQTIDTVIDRVGSALQRFMRS